VGASRAPFVEGQELDARLAIFLKFEEGKLVRQRTYSCFEPWSSEAESNLLLGERASAPTSFAVQRSRAEAADLRQGPESNFDIARSYLAVLSTGADAHEIARFFAEDAIEEEFPNRYEPKGAVRTFDDIRQARSLSLARLSTQSYELRGATGGGSQVAMEVGWTAVVREATGPIAAGQALEADIAVFLKFRDGLIVRQRNFPCVQAPSIKGARL
jgi:ketosteroid isomerase-like protein